MSVYFGGSRSLLPGQCPQLASLIPAVQAAGESVHVGCCIGADQQVIQAGMARPSFLVVFAQFSQTRQGALLSVSSVNTVFSARAAGAKVFFQAGGSVETMPPAARLIRRSQAALSGCEAAVFFHPGGGSMSVAHSALVVGIPVFVFGPRPLSLPGPGCWQPGQFFGFPCWQFQPAQASLF